MCKLELRFLNALFHLHRQPSTCPSASIDVRRQKNLCVCKNLRPCLRRDTGPVTIHRHVYDVPPTRTPRSWRQCEAFEFTRVGTVDDTLLARQVAEASATEARNKLLP